MGKADTDESQIDKYSLCRGRRDTTIHAGRATSPLRAILREHGYRLLELPADEELSRRRGMNFVAVGPSAVLMPSGCPGIRRRLEMEGISARCVDAASRASMRGDVG